MGIYSIIHFLILFLSGMRNDVFLSFNHSETGKKFADHLHSAISGAGFRTFVRATSGKETIEREIKKSRASVVVFSNHFASSSSCLDELVRIMEARNKSGQIVLPIYYHASPSDLRWLKGRYGDAFAVHEEMYAEEMERVDRWKAALTEVSYLQGMILRRSEGVFVKDIVAEIKTQLHYSSTWTFRDLHHPICSFFFFFFKKNMA